MPLPWLHLPVSECRARACLTDLLLPDWEEQCLLLLNSLASSLLPQGAESCVRLRLGDAVWAAGLGHTASWMQSHGLFSHEATPSVSACRAKVHGGEGNGVMDNTTVSHRLTPSNLLRRP